MPGTYGFCLHLLGHWEERPRECKGHHTWTPQDHQNCSSDRSPSYLFREHGIHSLFFLLLCLFYSTHDCKEIQPVHSKGDQSWVFIGRNDAKAETPILWLSHGKSWLIGKDSDAGRDWEQEDKGTTEDEMAGWHDWLDGRESERTPGVGDGQGGLACCNSWGRKESDTTEWLNWTELNWWYLPQPLKNLYSVIPSFSFWLAEGKILKIILQTVHHLAKTSWGFLSNQPFEA